MSPSFIVIFLNHLVSSADPEPTDLSSCTALALLDGQQPSSVWTGTERGGSINQHRSGCWQEIRRLCPGLLSEKSGRGLRLCVREGAEPGGIVLGVVTTERSLQGYSDRDTLLILRKHGAP